MAASAAVESFLGLSPIREARRQAIKLEENGGKFPSPDEGLPIIDLVIVAYLPNEQDIVKDQVLYALEELVYPVERLRVNLVYNTPYPIGPLETELRDMEHVYPQLRVEKVFGSKSKADNLNHFLTLDTGAYLDGKTLSETSANHCNLSMEAPMSSASSTATTTHTLITRAGPPSGS